MCMFDFTARACVVCLFAWNCDFIKEKKNTPLQPCVLFLNWILGYELRFVLPNKFQLRSKRKFTGLTQPGGGLKQMRTGRITRSEPCGRFAIDGFLKYSASKWLEEKKSQTRHSTNLDRFSIYFEASYQPPFFIALRENGAANKVLYAL